MVFPAAYQFQMVRDLPGRCGAFAEPPGPSPPFGNHEKPVEVGHESIEVLRRTTVSDVPVGPDQNQGGRVHPVASVEASVSRGNHVQPDGRFVPVDQHPQILSRPCGIG